MLKNPYPLSEMIGVGARDEKVEGETVNRLKKQEKRGLGGGHGDSEVVVMSGDRIGFLAPVKARNPFKGRPAGLFYDATSERNSLPVGPQTITLRTIVVNEMGRCGVVWLQHPMLESNI